MAAETETVDNPEAISIPDINLLRWNENITSIDISCREIVNLENVKLPPKLINLNISHNKLEKVPDAVFKINALKYLDLSHNAIIYFDETPRFCHSIECLILAWNKLKHPPYWIWLQSATNLTKLDLSNNHYLNCELEKEHIDEIVHYNTPVTHINISNCNLKGDQLKLLLTLPKAKVLQAGVADLRKLYSNVILQFPFNNFNISDIEILDLSNTDIHHIEPCISNLKYLKEINLSQNNIRGLPNEFYQLVNLEKCVLSSNNILYMPENIGKLKNLMYLHLDSNQLCMLPEDICELPRLKLLDLYDNKLNDVPDHFGNMLEKIDLAQNYLDEPCDPEYYKKKKMLRTDLLTSRIDGSKEDMKNESFSSSNNLSDDEENEIKQSSCTEGDGEVLQVTVDSEEDWDSDEYFVPHPRLNHPPKGLTLWHSFTRSKIAQGNFCPIDMHVPSAFQIVNMERKRNPPKVKIVIGQFDDIPGDDS